jgi:hypothetical protein
MGYLTIEDKAIIRHLKKIGVLRVFSADDLKGITVNGGVLVTCSDGQIDVSTYQKDAIHGETSEIKLPGGTLHLCSMFRGYKEKKAETIAESVIDLFEAKYTRTLFLTHHFPCGMASKYGHDIKDVFQMAYFSHVTSCTDLQDMVNQALPPRLHLEDDRIFDFFHIKKLSDSGVEEQRTYVFDPDLYAEYFIRMRAI